jgi:hypothetical protein
MDTTRARFHGYGKYCLRRTALNTFVRKVITSLEICLRTMFLIPLGPGVLPTWSPSGPLRVWLISVHFRAHTLMRASPQQQKSELRPGPTGRPPAGTELRGCRPGLPPSEGLRGLPPSEVLRGLFLPALARGATESEIPSPALSSSIATGPRCPRIPGHRSMDLSFIHSPGRSPNSGGGSNGLLERDPS